MQDARLFLVYGQVQGVGFRNFVQRRARQLGITGYAKNLADGSVEVLACGSRDAIEGLRGHLYQSPSWAEVRRVEEKEIAPTAKTSFEIL